MPCKVPPQKQVLVGQGVRFTVFCDNHQFWGVSLVHSFTGTMQTENADSILVSHLQYLSIARYLSHDPFAQCFVWYCKLSLPYAHQPPKAQSHFKCLQRGISACRDFERGVFCLQGAPHEIIAPISNRQPRNSGPLGPLLCLCFLTFRTVFFGECWACSRRSKALISLLHVVIEDETM